MLTPRRRQRRYWLLAAALALSAALASPARADRVALDKPVKITAAKADKSKLVGRVSSYDETGFELLKGATGDKDKVEVKWSELDAANVFAVRSSLLAKGTGADWIALGRDLRAFPDGPAFAEKAFARALRLDPKLKDAVDAARKEEVKPPAPPTGPGAGPTMPGGGAGPGPDDGAGGANPADTGASAGPQMIGQATETTWKVLTEPEQAAATKALDDFAAETVAKMKLELVRHETKFFLFYSDLPAKEAAEWAGLLDKMYARLAELFGIEKGLNVWRGKALVFVFSQAKDYQRFQRLMHNTDPGTSAGMCHSYSTGDVHIAFYRQADRMLFAHVLVHESVHGFLHRFRTPVPIPSWVNEGLAEVIGSDLVPRPARSNEVKSYAKRGMQQFGGLGGILEATPIVGWQYPVAESITRFMIDSNKRRYVDFVIGIKEGLTWQESLEQRFKAPRDKFVRVFGESMQIKNLAE